MGLVAGVDDGALQRRLQAHLLFKEVGPLGDLEARVGTAVLGAHLAGADEDLPRHEERGQVADDVGEGKLAGQQIVLVGAVGVALAVAVVLVDADPLLRLEHVLSGSGRPGHDELPGLVIAGCLERLVALRGRVLGVGMVDVQPGPVGQHDVDHPGVHLRRPHAVESEAAGVAAGGFLFERPLHPHPGAAVGVDDQRGRQRRIEVGLVADDDAVLRLGAENLVYRHDQRYWPVVIASMVRLSSSPSIKVRT